MFFFTLLLSTAMTIYRNNPTYTPGAADHTRTKQILCAKGYTTRSVRPPASYTEMLKREQMKAWNLPGAPGDYEEDHLISLELGGDPRSQLNLWPQAYCPPKAAGKICFGAREKDEVEDWLHKQVCSGKMSLHDAQQAIRTNWYLVYQKMKGA